MVSGGDDCEAKLWDLRQKRSVKTLGEKYQVGAGGCGLGWGCRGAGVAGGGAQACPRRVGLRGCAVETGVCSTRTCPVPCTLLATTVARVVCSAIRALPLARPCPQILTVAFSDGGDQIYTAGIENVVNVRGSAGAGVCVWLHLDQPMCWKAPAQCRDGYSLQATKTAEADRAGHT